MKIGLVGCGRWGRNILKTIKGIKNKEIDLCCITSNNKSIKSQVPKNCFVYKKWDEMSNHPGLDGVIVATPPSTHYEIAKKYLMKGINVLVEKPLTLLKEDAYDLKKLSLENNALLMTEFTQVFNSKFIKLDESIHLIGSIKSVITEAGNFGPVRKDVPVLWDWGSHELSILISLIGTKPKFIKATKLNEEICQDGDKSSWKIDCSFINQIKSTSIVSNIFSKRRRIGVLGIKGMIVLDNVGKYPLTFYKGYKNNQFPKDKGLNLTMENNQEPLLSALIEFFNCIRNKDKNHWSLDLGIQVTELLEQCSEDHFKFD